MRHHQRTFQTQLFTRPSRYDVQNQSKKSKKINKTGCLLAFQPKTYIWWLHTLLLIDWTSVALRWHVCRPDTRWQTVCFPLSLSSSTSDSQVKRKSSRLKEIWNLEDGRETGSDAVIYSRRHKQSQINGLFPARAHTHAHTHTMLHLKVLDKTKIF